MAGINAGQSEAIFSDSSKILCLAGAGTGKTYTLIERISRLVAMGVEPSSILCITFTNAAAFEMQDRFKRKHPNDAVPVFKTFHSFCYDILISNKSIRLQLGYSAIPSIADEVTEKRILKQASMQVGIRLSQDKLSGKKMMTEAERQNYQILKKAAQRLMKQQNVITFDMLLHSVSNLFIESSPLVDGYKDRFKYVFVDEFQDTSPIEWKFVQSFTHSNLFVVGDALQNLYSFRGSDASIIKSLAENLDWQVIRIEENYRSTKEICEYANKFTATYAQDSYRLEIKSDKSGPAVNTIVSHEYVKHGQVLDDVLESILEKNRIASGTSAILSRTNAESEFVQEYLKANHINFVTSKQDDDLIHIIKSIYDDEYMMNWLATFLIAERYSEYIRRRAIAAQPYTRDMFSREFGCVKSIDIRLRMIYEIRQICDQSISILDKLHKILNALKYPNLYVDASNCTEVPALLSLIGEAIESSCTETSDLYVGTVHSVKGLEYDNVYIVGVDGPSFRLTNEDNNNIFYVAVTRARQNLTVYRNYQ